MAWSGTAYLTLPYCGISPSSSFFCHDLLLPNPFLLTIHSDRPIACDTVLIVQLKRDTLHKKESINQFAQYENVSKPKFIQGVKRQLLQRRRKACNLSISFRITYPTYVLRDGDLLAARFVYFYSWFIQRHFKLFRLHGVKWQCNEWWTRKKPTVWRDRKRKHEIHQAA
jgi:hypothetical protein